MSTRNIIIKSKAGHILASGTFEEYMSDKKEKWIFFKPGIGEPGVRMKSETWGWLCRALNIYDCEPSANIKKLNENLSDLAHALHMSPEE